MCANQRRPACRWEPISAFQRAAAQPIAGLHDGEEVTAYIWREHNSFNIIVQKPEYRTYIEERHTLQRGNTRLGNVKAVNSLTVLRLRFLF
ncbi:endoplasmic reticulum chaperone BiP isoform X1 [Lates japonicus]|uniref:Endoplasmic reticulum chaperone BiP isoform X1 n=1 Tax=Lates japonicus TaxID=270547 RepID=A0AAD3MJN7_LATJO|nr:endoplasmic reticulum chaperone BiP isoform X1 [Lates japonicus]